jgi:hypothetical protein
MTVKKALLVGFFTCVTAIASQAAESSKFVEWLKTYVPAAYPGVKVVEHGGGEWYQAKVTDSNSNSVTASWAVMPKKAATLGKVEGVKPGKPLFIAVGKQEKWTGVEGATYTENAGYYVAGYNASTMGAWVVENEVVMQFNGNAKEFAEKMAKAWAKENKKK